MNKEKNIFIIASIVTLGIFAIGYFLIKPKSSKPTGKGLQIPNILIGDSQTPYVARNSKNFKLISPTGSESSLWKGGMGLSWLLGAVSKFEISPDVRNVGIVIGTNGGFNPKDNISGLMTELKRVFPNAKFYAIKGSWGWGGNKNITESKVNDYYSKFASQGAKVIATPIGAVEPHANLPVYAKIGTELDSNV